MGDRKIKREFKYFTIPQWTQEQDYLREQHKKGWKFTRVSFPGIYSFESCQPEDVIYQLDYNQEGLTHKEEYLQMFSDCGWEYLQDFVGYSYFRKPVSRMDAEEEIFCDDASRLDMMRRVIRGRMLPMAAILFCVIIPQLFMQNAETGIRGVLFWVFAVFLVVYLALFISFGYQFWKYRKSLYK